MQTKKSPYVTYKMYTRYNNYTEDMKKARKIEVYCKDNCRRTLIVQPKNKPAELTQAIYTLYYSKD